MPVAGHSGWRAESPFTGYLAKRPLKTASVALLNLVMCGAKPIVRNRFGFAAFGNGKTAPKTACSGGQFQQ